MAKPILIIDDEPEMLSALQTFLKLRGIECETAQDPRVGLARMEEEPFKVVLLDIVMPEMDGLEVLGQLKAKHPQLEVVMMTANSTLDRVARARELGASDFILKPFADLEQMGSIVLLAVERVERWQAVTQQSTLQGGYQ